MTLLGHFVAGVLADVPVWLVDKETGEPTRSTWLEYRRLPDPDQFYALPTEFDALRKINEMLIARLRVRS